VIPVDHNKPTKYNTNMPTLNGDAASSAAQTQTPTPSPEPALPPPVGFGDNGPADAKDVNPDSSTGVEKPDANGPKDLLSAVRNVVSQTKADAQTAGDSSTPTEDGTTEPTNPAAHQDGNAGEDDSKLPFHNHPRWKQMLAERDSLKEDASQYQQVVSFMRGNNLNAQEVAQGMQVMALIKNDPLRALEALKPTIEHLRQFAGESLPDDIKQKVDGGFIDHESASELARQRAQAQFMTARQQQELEAYQAAQLQQQQAASMNSIMTAVSGWESQLKTRDADYQAKSQFIGDRIRVLLQQGHPQTPQEAVALAERAYNEVNQSFKGMNPRRQPVRTMTSGNSATSATPAPKSLREAIMMAAGKS
jgi:hypothetical protein